MFGVESKTRFKWVVAWLPVESAMLVLGWRLGDQHEIIWGEEECGGVATTTTHCALWFHARVWHRRLIGGVHYFQVVVCAEGYQFTWWSLPQLAHFFHAAMLFSRKHYHVDELNRGTLTNQWLYWLVTNFHWSEDLIKCGIASICGDVIFCLWTLRYARSLSFFVAMTGSSWLIGQL